MRSAFGVTSVVSFILATVFVGQGASAQYNQCSPAENSSTPRRSICKGAPDISGNVTRDFRNQTLQCSSNADVFIRRPQNMSEIFHKWRDAGNGLSGKAKQSAMQDFAQSKLPLIKWDGRVPYEVVETWEWTECAYGQDLSCGTYECNCSDVRDSEGRVTGQSCQTCIHSCWHNSPRSESRHCSYETLTYDAQYERPTKQQWSPDSQGYYDIIPNKYDLLPAEIETVQLFSNDSFSENLTPVAKIGDAWNTYQLALSIDGYGASVRCEDRVNRHANLNIRTLGRKMGKKTPNAYKVVEGQDPLEYSLASGEGPEEGRRIRPVRIKLVDVAGSMIAAMADQSREFEAARAQRKNDLGTDSNVSQKDQEKQIQNREFNKNTKVRVRLFRDRIGRDRLVSQKWDGSDISSVQFNSQMATSDSAQERLSDYWELDIDGQDSLYHPSSMFFNSITRHMNKNLAPNTKYKILVSMFQEGVPFYAQGCQGIWCYAPVNDWRENSYYSKDLVIPFRTGNVDNRRLSEKFNDWNGEKWQWFNK